MRLILFRFVIVIEFHPPKYGGFEWDGLEEHTEYMYATSAEVAARSIKKMIMDKVGTQKDRVMSLTISDPFLINESEEASHV